MAKQFKRIGIIGRYRSQAVVDTLRDLIEFLQARGLAIHLDQETGEHLEKNPFPTYSKETLGAHCDLFIIIGGDGSFLGAAKNAVTHHIPVIGINRGTLGFLTDISPDDFRSKLEEVLNGEYHEEQRFLLSTQLTYEHQVFATGDALNDIVLLPGDVPHMIEFETYINNKFMCKQRADGLIVATPTGSTAYALSAGGPILHPQLDAIVLVPMFPHKLSSRPIVINGDSHIKIVITTNTESPPKVSCDGQERIAIKPKGIIEISKKSQPLRILHPSSYYYFETLRNKLGWEESKI